VVLIYIVSALISFVSMAFWFLMIWDCIKRGNAYFWLTILIFLGPMGAVIYYLMNRPPIEIPGLSGLPGLSALRVNTHDEGRIKEMKAKIARAPDARLYADLGRAYLDEKNMAEARAALEKSLEMEPENARVRLLMGKVLLADEKVQDAIPFLEAVLDTDDRDRFSEASRLLAENYEALGHDDRAIEYYEKLIKCYPFSKDRYAYGMLLEKQNRPDEAKAQMEAIVRESADLPSFSLKHEKEWIRKAEAFLRKFNP
jgi:hypothetical protein